MAYVIDASDDRKAIRPGAGRPVRDGMYICISPIRKGGAVNSNTTRAGWSENAAEQIAELSAIAAVPVYELALRQGSEAAAHD